MSKRYIYGAYGELIAQFDNLDNITVDYWNISGPAGETIGRKGLIVPPDGIGDVIKMNQATFTGYNRFYYLKDHLGSVRVTLNQSGSVVGHDDYYPFGLHNLSRPFGMPGRSNNSANRDDDQKFTGYHLEQEGDLDIYFAGSRLYDVETGRFYGVDRFNTMYPDLSTYQYTALNPISFIDVNVDSLWISHRGNELLYENGTLFNQDGSEYSGSMRGFLGQVVEALDTIRNGGESGQSLIEGLRSANENIFISSSNSNRFSLEPGRIEISWNSTSTAGGPDEDGNTTREPFLGLTHELGHAQDYIQNNHETDSRSWFRMSDGTPIPRAEIYAVHIENKIRAEHRLPLRTLYGIDHGTP